MVDENVRQVADLINEGFDHLASTRMRLKRVICKVLFWRKYFFTSLAANDFESIYQGLALNDNDSYEKSDLFADTFHETLRKLATGTEAGKLYTDIAGHAFKAQTFLEKYHVIYRESKPLDVVRVLKGYEQVLN